MKFSIFLYSSLFVILFGCQSRLSRLTQLPPITNPQNVLIDSNNQVGSFHPCEPSIYVSPSNPDQIVAGAVLNRIYHSHDQGKTWSMQLVSSTYGVYGDPVISADNLGNFYYAHLADPSGEGRAAESWLDRIVVQRSTDGGITWSNGSFTGHRPPADQDKHWIAVDPKSQTLYMTWTEFDKYGSADPDDHSRILFSKSVDQGQHWSDARSISSREGNCLDDDRTTEGAVPAVGPKGQVYVSWAYNEQIYFDRSMDGGTNWLEDDIVASEQQGGWSFDIPGLGRANGMPVTAVDLSKSKYRGRVYINYCDQASGSDDTDVRLIYSDDEGSTWSSPKRVNDDGPGKHQFFTWMSVDPVTGAIYIIFYDRRAHADNHTDVYLAYSLDGGQHFKNVEISSSPFLPNTSMFFGDYNNISAYNGFVRPIWTRMDSNKTSIWTALIDMR